MGFGSSCPRRLLILPEYYVSFQGWVRVGYVCRVAKRGQRCVKSTVCALGAPGHEAVSAASSEAQWQPGEAQVRLPKKTFDAIKS